MSSGDLIGRRAAFLRHPLVQIGFGFVAGVLGFYHFLLLRAALAMHGNDFGKFYFACRAWLAGGSLYDVTVATRLQSGTEFVDFLNMNPPHFHLAVLPFTLLPLPVAYVAWLSANLACGVAAAMIVGRRLHIQISGWHVAPTVCAVLLFAATGAISVTGQVTGMLLLPIALAWDSARRDRWPQCGVWLGVAAGIKPFLLLFVPALVVMRRPRAALALCATAAAGMVAGIAVFGWSAHLEWLHALRSVSWVWGRMNGSIAALWTRAFESTPEFSPVDNAPWLVTPLSAGCIIAVVLATLAAARRSVDHAFGAVVLASLLVSPLGWVYYLWLALPACMALWRQRIPPLAAAAAVTLAMPMLALGAGQPSPMATLTVASSYVWGTLGLWLAVVLSPRPAASGRS
jgi:hypothetical protein